MKKIVLILAFCFTCGSSPLFAQSLDWNVATNDPIQLLDKVVGVANEEHSIQETKLDGVSSQGGGYSGNPDYRFTNTLEYLKNNINPYLQRIVFI
ncbi:MAG: hypothetical protein LBO09_03190 [Candidatus Peribacteria bacterium]|jgi:hypothetical protein|nr:hypothetical protein [Candidatus Peribacteria bacterium]